MIAIDSHEAASSAGGLMRRAAVASLAVSALLVAIKCYAYITSCSVAVLASLADSGLDLFTSIVNLIAIRSALTPADAEHRFGHGKAEPLAGLAQGAFIVGSATFLIVQAVTRLVDPEPVEEETVTLAIMCVSIVLALGLVMFQRYVVSRTGSVAISADRIHYLGDVATNVGVIVALLLVWRFDWQAADPIIAILVALVLIWSAWGVFRQSYDQLMDRELPDTDRARIKEVVMRHHEVRSLHDLRTRMAGVHTFIQFHVELDPEISLMRAHQVSDEVERAICAEFPRAEVIIHQDPTGAEMHPPLAAS